MNEFQYKLKHFLYMYYDFCKFIGFPDYFELYHITIKIDLKFYTSYSQEDITNNLYVQVRL